MARRTSNTVDLVTMTKDGTETTVVRSAFEKVWKDKGWSLKEEEPVNQTQATGTSAKGQTGTSQTDPSTEAQTKR